jgi:hypothetical protein
MPILTCGTKTWTWTKADISRLMAAQARFLRGVEGISKTERIIREKNERV